MIPLFCGQRLLIRGLHKLPLMHETGAIKACVLCAWEHQLTHLREGSTKLTVSKECIEPVKKSGLCSTKLFKCFLSLLCLKNKTKYKCFTATSTIQSALKHKRAEKGVKFNDTEEFKVLNCDGCRIEFTFISLKEWQLLSQMLRKSSCFSLLRAPGRINNRLKPIKRLIKSS